MKKVVLKLDLHDDKDKKKAMRTVSGISGIDSIAMDMKEKKLTVMGEVDPVQVVNKLRKSWHTEIFSVGPATKEPEKKKDDQTSSNNKKGGGCGGGGGEGDSGGEKRKDQESGGNKNKGGGGDDGDQRRLQMMTQAHYPNEVHMTPPVDLVRTYQAYQQYQPPVMDTHYYIQSAEENPNACVIC